VTGNAVPSAASAAPSAVVGVRAAGDGAEAAPARPRNLAEQLFAETYAFDFFQAVRILERLAPARVPLGRGGPPSREVVRLRAHASLTFPPSALYELERPASPDLPPVLTVNFMGLTGPSGVLPRHYTEMLVRLERELKGPEKYAFRDWFDLFDHRWISLFYRAWEKYRFYIPYERGEHAGVHPDPFTQALFSYVGLGMPSLRHRLRVSAWETVGNEIKEKPLARIDDLALLYYGGLLAHRPRSAVALEGLLADYFHLPMRVRQFQGQWLVLDADSQSRLGAIEGNNALGVSSVAGERVWDVQSKFRVRVGPLSYAQFQEFLPDRGPVAEHKAFFLLVHLVTLYAGADVDFDVQLVLRAREVPACQLNDDSAEGARLGWNTWLSSQPFGRDCDDAVFEGEEVFWTDRLSA
jgi:type VI secretion system protein ImpH